MGQSNPNIFVRSSVFQVLLGGSHAHWGQTMPHLTFSAFPQGHCFHCGIDRETEENRQGVVHTVTPHLLSYRSKSTGSVMRRDGLCSLSTGWITHLLGGWSRNLVNKWKILDILAVLTCWCKNRSNKKTIFNRLKVSEGYNILFKEQSARAMAWSQRCTRILSI